MVLDLLVAATDSEQNACLDSLIVWIEFSAETDCLSESLDRFNDGFLLKQYISKPDVSINEKIWDHLISC